MQQFVVICLLVVLPICIAQGRRPKNGANQDTRADIRKCRDCRRFFKGDNFQLCLKLFCSTDKTRKNLKNRKRCNSCTRFRAQKKQQTCREVFCEVPTSLDPNAFSRIATALTVDMLCQYCRIRRNRNCLRKFGCQG
ncbi:unnamed protein product [Mytilus coruscus]|uniref:Uncharacterized protein n=1 Tax=Mytilus coruscus TaxID=42192 RepID=A0A6J8E1E3_MYTCO|nr:unnamed protein product [Mytilus coruscus]